MDPMPAPQLRPPAPRATFTLVVLNVLVYGAMVVAGVSFEHPNPDQILRWGVDFGPLTLHGEWWRLGTSMFVHFGFLHLAFNMWALLNLGLVAERLFGSRRFLALYVLSGLGGSLASVLVHPMVVGAGASGAIFGVAGGLIVALRLKGGAPVRPGGRLMSSLLLFVLYNLFFGFTTPGIDNFAHLGGLVTGAAFAAALVLRPTTSLAILTAGFALILAGGAYVTRWVRAAVVSEFWADERVPVSLPDVGKEVTRLQRLVAKRPDSIELYTALGTAYMEESLFDNAIAVLQQAHARRPANAGVLTALGTAYLNESRLDEAIAAFTPVVRGDSANADARYNLAAAYLVRGVGLADSNVARARADFERVVQLEADSQLVAEARRLIRQLPTAARRPPPLSRP